MINITITIENISNILTIYDKIQLLRYTGDGVPSTPLNLSEFGTILEGVDQISNRTNVSDIFLTSSYAQYYFIDLTGSKTDWYISRYINDALNTFSSWSSPLQGEVGNFYYNPLYPYEVSYSNSDKLIINRIRLLIGDPVGLSRLHGQEALAHLHPDKQVFELEERGWPYSVNMFNTQYTSTSNPTVNGYKYLRFSTPLDTSITTVSGIDTSVDIWYHTFRNSDKQIMNFYDNCYPPTPLTISNCTPDIYMMQTAYDILNSETWEAVSEDGVLITDNRDTYDPTPGLQLREKLLARLKASLEAAIKALRLSGIGGIRID